jgi:hypothetical protein
MQRDNLEFSELSNGRLFLLTRCSGSSRLSGVRTLDTGNYRVFRHELQLQSQRQHILAPLCWRLGHDAADGGFSP